MTVVPELLAVLTNWKQSSEFPEEEDWVFASPLKLGRLPYSYTGFWRELQRAAENAGLGARLVAGRGMGVLHLHDVHGHLFRGAHPLVLRTDPALAGSFADRQPIRTHPSHHPEVRTLHGILYFFSVALPRRARRPQRVALDVGHRGALLRRGIFGPG